MILFRRFYNRSCLYQQNKTKFLFRTVVYALLITVVVACSLYTIDWNVHVSIKPWLRYWNSSPTTDTISASAFSPYPSCFQTPYATQLSESPPLTPGVPLTRLDECLGFAKSINNVDSHTQQSGSIWFHTYWKAATHTDSETSAQLMSMLRSFSATQSGHSPKMKIWVHDQHQQTLLLHSETWHLAKQHMEGLGQELTSGVWTEMPESIAAKDQDWNNMDYIGLLILQQHGGVWFHPSTVFIRDWSALIGKREWMIQHDCEATHTGHVSLVDNGLQQRTMMHFFANSTLLCQLIETATIEGRTTKKMMNLGRVYKTVYRNMIQNGIRPWSLLPWCFMNSADGCSSTNTNAFQLFEKPNKDTDAKTLVGESGVFALQYDVKQWNAQPGTLANLLDQAHQIKSGW